jgi:hypothetical protein
MLGGIHGAAAHLIAVSFRVRRHPAMESRQFLTREVARGLE